MILPSLVRSAIEFLKQAPNQPLSKEKVEAYARLSAWRDHFPSQRTLEIEKLLKNHSSIKSREYSRYLKQRRLALSMICAEIANQNK